MPPQLPKGKENKMNFNDLNNNLVCRRTQDNGGVQYIFRFDNGYGASLVSADGYRIAPLQFNSNDIDYNNIVIGDDLNSDASINWNTPIDPMRSYTATYIVLDTLQTISNL